MALPLRDQRFPSREIYKDFDISFTPHPLTGDIGVKTDVAAVRQSLRNLILTNFYERPFAPDIGSDVTRLLFEPVDVLTVADIRQAIYEVVANYEPRVTIKDVLVVDNAARNAYTITIVFSMTGIYEDQQSQIVLQRLR